MEPHQRNREIKEAPRGIGGWLAFLCFALVIGSPLLDGVSIAQMVIDDNTIYDIDLTLGSFVVIGSIVTGLLLWFENRYAVIVAKTYFISIIVIFGGLALLVGSEITPYDAGITGRNIISSVIGLAYLFASKRVQNTWLRDESYI